MIDVTIGRGNYQVVISDESGRLRKGGGGEGGGCRFVRCVPLEKRISPLMKVASIDNSPRGNFIAKLLIRDIH